MLEVRDVHRPAIGGIVPQQQLFRIAFSRLIKNPDEGIVVVEYATPESKQRLIFPGSEIEIEPQLERTIEDGRYFLDILFESLLNIEECLICRGALAGRNGIRAVEGGPEPIS